MAWPDWARLFGRGGNNIPFDFPESAGDRERGKHRPSAFPRLTQVAICDDNGDPVGSAQTQVLRDILIELRFLHLAMVAAGTAEEVSPRELELND